MRTLFLFRPEPGASISAARARAMGMTVVTSPLFEVLPIAWSVPAAKYDSLMLTSANAVLHAGPTLQRFAALPVAAVGAETAAAARAAGLKVRWEGRGGARELVASLPVDQRFLHLCGSDRTRVPGTEHIVTLPVYEAVPTKAPDLAGLYGSVGALHSSRAAHRLASLIPATDARRGTIALVTLSEAVARAAGSGWQCVTATVGPSDAALLALAAGLCLEGGR